MFPYNYWYGGYRRRTWSISSHENRTTDPNGWCESLKASKLTLNILLNFRMSVTFHYIWLFVIAIVTLYFCRDSLHWQNKCSLWLPVIFHGISMWPCWGLYIYVYLYIRSHSFIIIISKRRLEKRVLVPLPGPEARQLMFQKHLSDRIATGPVLESGEAVDFQAVCLPTLFLIISLK